MTFETDAEELRRTARFVEAVGLDLMAQMSQLEFPLAIGGLKDFPRPAPEDRAAIQGIRRLRRQLENASTELYALAFAYEAGLEVPDVVLSSVDDYIEAYREVSPGEQPYLIRTPNEGVDDDEFMPVDLDEVELDEGDQSTA